MVCGRRASIPVDMCLGLRKGSPFPSVPFSLSPLLLFPPVRFYRSPLVLFFPRVSIPFLVALTVARKYRLSLKVNGRNRELHVRARSNGVMRRRVCRAGVDRRDRAGRWSGRTAREEAQKGLRVAMVLTTTMVVCAGGPLCSWLIVKGWGFVPVEETEPAISTFPCALLHTPHTTIPGAAENPQKHTKQRTASALTLATTHHPLFRLSFQPPSLCTVLTGALRPVPIHACTRAFCARTEDIASTFLGRTYCAGSVGARARAGARFGEPRASMIGRGEPLPAVPGTRCAPW